MPQLVLTSRRVWMFGVVGFGLFPHAASSAEVACSSRQLDIARASMQRAKAAVNTTINRLENPNNDILNHVNEWFGAVTPRTISTLKSVYTRVAVFADGTSFRCLNESRGVYAYVYASSPFGITLGDLFFPAPDTGFDSKPGILIHEMTHFTLVGGTGDAGGRYGVTAARDRARNDPAQALRTADNFEYLVEAVAL